MSGSHAGNQDFERKRIILEIEWSGLQATEFVNEGRSLCVIRLADTATFASDFWLVRTKPVDPLASNSPKNVAQKTALENRGSKHQSDHLRTSTWPFWHPKQQTELRRISINRIPRRLKNFPRNPTVGRRTFQHWTHSFQVSFGKVTVTFSTDQTSLTIGQNCTVPN